jgi:hypothetical protein
MKNTALVIFLLGLSVCPVSAESEITGGSVWIHNAGTPDGRSYLDGFARGYIEGNRGSLERVEAILAHATFDPASRIDRKQIESKLFMETLSYARALEEENLKKAVDQVTRWYQDPKNRMISWGKLVDLAVGEVTGLHRNYVDHQLRWLQEVTTNKRIDWFHTIDPATGEGTVITYDTHGKIVRTELVR